MSWIFYPNNEEWSNRYIDAGMYEINILGDYFRSPTIPMELATSFFNGYKTAIGHIRERQASVVELMNQHYSTEQAQDYLEFLTYETRRQRLFR